MLSQSRDLPSLENFGGHHARASTSNEVVVRSTLDQFEIVGHHQCTRRTACYRPSQAVREFAPHFGIQPLLRFIQDEEFEWPDERRSKQDAAPLPGRKFVRL